MKKFLLILTLLIGISCSPDTANKWLKSFGERATTHAAASVSQFRFSKIQQKDLERLAYEILQSKNCRKIQLAIDENHTIYELERDYYLKRNFFYKEILNFSFTNTILDGLTEIGTQKSTTAAIVTAWKQHYTIDQIKYIISQIKKCKSNS